MYFISYNIIVLTIGKTNYFIKWLRKLKDRRARTIIVDHIDRMEEGNFGDSKSVGGGLFEKRINYGPGYRLYYCQIDQMWILLLCGGDKSTQKDDIEQAKIMKRGLK